MSHALRFWLMKRNKDPFVRRNARAEIRHSMRQQLYADNGKGRGNRAWKRADALDRDPGVIVWPYYAI